MTPRDLSGYFGILAHEAWHFDFSRSIKHREFIYNFQFGEPINERNKFRRPTQGTSEQGQ